MVVGSMAVAMMVLGSVAVTKTGLGPCSVAVAVSVMRFSSRDLGSVVIAALVFRLPLPLPLIFNGTFLLALFVATFTPVTRDHLLIAFAAG